MYRMLLCTFTLTMTGLISGCGQSGALVLPSDPNYDKRSHYLLYPNPEQKPAQTTEKTTSETSSTVQN